MKLTRKQRKRANQKRNNEIEVIQRNRRQFLGARNNLLKEQKNGNKN